MNNKGNFRNDKIMPFVLAYCIIFRITFQLSENIQLESRADPEVANCSGRTALLLAYESGNMTVLYELLNHPSLPSTINKNKSGFEPSPSWTRKRLNSGRALSSQDIERTNSHFRGNTPLLNVCWRIFFSQVTSLTIKLVFIQSQRMRWDKLMNRYEIELKQSNN